MERFTEETAADLARARKARRPETHHAVCEENIRDMENMRVRTTGNRVGVLTTDHASSSYGQPVLLVDGVAYGPGDTIDRQPVLVTVFKALPKVIDLAAALRGPIQDPPAIIKDWNRKVVEANTQGKHWDESVLDFVPDVETRE